MPSLKYQGCCFCCLGQSLSFSIDGIFSKMTAKHEEQSIWDNRENLVAKLHEEFTKDRRSLVKYNDVFFLKFMTHLHQSPLQDFSQDLKDRRV